MASRSDKNFEDVLYIGYKVCRPGRVNTSAALSNAPRNKSVAEVASARLPPAGRKHAMARAKTDGTAIYAVMRLTALRTTVTHAVARKSTNIAVGDFLNSAVNGAIRGQNILVLSFRCVINFETMEI